MTGVIALGSTMPYTAGELKLLNTPPLQTATAIENARLFERTVQAARERERLLALHQQAEQNTADEEFAKNGCSPVCGRRTASRRRR